MGVRGKDRILRLVQAHDSQAEQNARLTRENARFARDNRAESK